MAYKEAVCSDVCALLHSPRRAKTHFLYQMCSLISFTEYLLEGLILSIFFSRAAHTIKVM